MLHDPRVRVVSFTGSTEVGRKLLHEAADNILKPAMELGGNAPFIVFEDADIDAAIEGAMIAKMRNMGEACTAANRFYVHEKVHGEFAKKLTDKMAALKMGNGLDDGVALGPLVNAEGRDKVIELVDDAVKRGAKILTGGKKPEGPGFFYPATVLDDVPDGAKMLNEEIFGPVASIQTFKSEDEAIKRANDTEYGLVAYLYTKDLSRGMRVSEKLDFGMIGLNRGLVSDPAAPFGGMKQSGLGREGAHEGLMEFMETQYISVSLVSTGAEARGRAMDVLMPQLGETVAEGKISKWFVAAGDAVKPGDNLFEIETDKVSMEVPAIAAGTLAAIHVQAGEIAPVGAVVAIIQGNGEAVSLRSRKRPHPQLRSSRESGDPEPRKDWVPAFAGTSGVAATARASRWSPSARSARPSATSARRGLPAAPSSRRWRGGSRVKRESISPTSKAPARTAASWRRRRDARRKPPLPPRSGRREHHRLTADVALGSGARAVRRRAQAHRARRRDRQGLGDRAARASCRTQPADIALAAAARTRR